MHTIRVYSTCVMVTCTKLVTNRPAGLQLLTHGIQSSTETVGSMDTAQHSGMQVTLSNVSL